MTHSCLSQVTVPWAEQDGRWKLYYDTNSYKMHTYRQDIFNSHPYQNNFKRYFLESKATNQIHHNLIMHKQTAQHSSGSRSPPPHFHVFPFRFVSLVPSAVLPLCTLFPLNLSDLFSLCPSLSVLQVTTIEYVTRPSTPLCPASGGRTTFPPSLPLLTLSPLQPFSPSIKSLPRSCLPPFYTLTILISRGAGNGNPLRYCHLENSMDRRA